MTERAPFRYEERAPGPGAAPWVLAYYRFEADRAPEPNEPYTVWPDGCASVAIVHPRGVPPFVALIGPRYTALRPTVTAGLRILGIRAWPDTAGALAGVHAPLLRNLEGPAPTAIAERFHPLGAVLTASDTPREQFAALDARVVVLLRNAPPPDPALRAAVRAIVASGGDARLRDVARAAGMSPRHLQRRFPAATGLTVREYSRVRRLRGALAIRLDHSAHWSRIAAESGFVDHAHLTREFGALAGLSPSRAAAQLTRTAHVNVTP